MAHSGSFFLSKREQMEFLVIEKFRRGELSRVEAALKLNCSIRTISRKAKKIRLNGFSGLKHGNYGKAPKNKKADNLKEKMIKLYKEKYYDFNFFHALEMIVRNEHLTESVSYQTFRKWCRNAGLGKVKRRRASKSRMHRERSAETGFMLQLDGSPHKYNGKDEWSCIAMIDDASSEVPFAKFFPSETTWACMEVVSKIVEVFGAPEFILTDRAGWSVSKGKRASFTQFERACNELDITVIATSSPESKGRIERFNRTIQDRIIPEMRLLNVKTMIDCNRYLEQVFLKEFNEKFTVEPRSSENRYRRIPERIDLRDVFCYKKQRVVNKASLVSYNNELYKILSLDHGNMSQKQVTVHEYQDGSISVFYGGQKLKVEKIIKPKKRNWLAKGA